MNRYFTKKNIWLTSKHTQKHMKRCSTPLSHCCCSVTQLWPTLCGPVVCGTSGFPVLHHHPELAQTHVHWVSDAIQPSHPLSFLKPFSSVQFSSVTQSCPTLQPHELQHARPPCPSPTPRVHSDLRPLSRWCHPAISFSVVPFFSCPQSLPALESFPMSQLFTWGGQSTGVSALASFLPKNTQDWFPLAWTGWISLQSKGLSRVFSNTTVQKHQFFCTQLSSHSNSHTHTWPLEKP